MERFLDQYGLAAVFGLMLVKGIGVPVPIPADVIMLGVGVRVAQGGMELWAAFVVILMAMVVGGLAQFALARGLGRTPLYRFGRYLGLTEARLDTASNTVRRGGPIGIGIAILTPGIRAVTVAACGLVGLRLRTFVPGLILGSSLFLLLHLVLGYVGQSLLSMLADGVSLPWLVALIVALLFLGVASWIVIRRRQRPGASRVEVAAEAIGAWHEATCPLCLVLGMTSHVNPTSP
jgi:membrane protein DedA with SNARE-associated domain